VNPALQLATLIVAILALVVASASLTWNVVQFLLGGSRPTALLVVGALAPGGMVTMEAGSDTAKELDRLAATDGYNQGVIGVRVINRGRAPTTVQRWEIKTDDPSGISLNPLGESIGPPLPHVLAAGAQETWVTDLAHAARLAAATAGTFNRPLPPVYGVVELGTGRALRSKRSLRVN
jgi:hypothetical protein